MTTLADMITDYISQYGQELTDEQKSAIELIEQLYPNQLWTLKDAQ